MNFKYDLLYYVFFKIYFKIIYNNYQFLMSLLTSQKDLTKIKNVE